MMVLALRFGVAFTFSVTRFFVTLPLGTRFSFGA